MITDKTALKYAKELREYFKYYCDKYPFCKGCEFDIDDDCPNLCDDILELFIEKRESIKEYTKPS